MSIPLAATSVATNICNELFLNLRRISKRFDCVISPCKPSAKYPFAINALDNSSTRRLVRPKTIAKLGF